MHMHLAVHVPNDLVKPFREKVVDWVKASTNPDEYQDRAVKVEWIWTVTNDALLRYFMKGASTKTRAEFKVPEKHALNQGPVQGKRCEASRNLRDISWPDAGDGPVPLEKIFWRGTGS